MKSNCWIWQKKKDKDGYGRVKINGRSYYAHRVSFALFGKFLNSRQIVCHKCDVPSCWNPDHLFSGYSSDNALDAYRKGRHSQKGDRNNGKKLTSEEVEKIWSLRRTGRYKQKQLGSMFGVTQSNISMILRGKSWR